MTFPPPGKTRKERIDARERNYYTLNNLTWLLSYSMTDGIMDKRRQINGHADTTQWTSGYNSMDTRTQLNGQADTTQWTSGHNSMDKRIQLNGQADTTQ